MRNIDRRLECLEASATPATESERRSWRTPEQQASRARQFEDLFRELGISPRQSTRAPEEAFEELFDEIENYRRARGAGRGSPGPPHRQNVTRYCLETSG